MRKIMVIGGAGYVGSHCAKAVRAAGHEPVVFDNLSTGHSTFCRWGPLMRGDVRSADDLDRAFSAFRPDAVMLFAAQSIVPHSVTDPAATYEANTVGALNVLNAMRRHGVRSLVFSSTCAVYGAPATLPISEAAPTHPISPYGTSKRVVECMLADFAEAYGMNHVALRYFNAAGATPSGEIGEWHEPETHLIPIVLDVALGVRPTLAVYGADYDTPDGTCIRDFIHVDDLASAHVKGLAYLLNGGESAILNLGTGQGASVLEVVRTVEQVTGRPVPLQHLPRRPGDPPALYADPRRARTVLGWSAERGLADTIADAWAWHQALRSGAVTERHAHTTDQLV